MRVIKKKKVKGSLLLRFAILCLAVYIMAALINQQMQINEKKSQLESLQDQIQVHVILLMPTRRMAANMQSG